MQSQPARTSLETGRQYPRPMLGVLIAAFLAIPPVLAAAAPPPAADTLTEATANGWDAAADEATASLYDDDTRIQAGSYSIRLETDAPYDCRMWAPAARDAQWDLRRCTDVAFWVYAVNPNLDFQDNNPWIRLGSSESDYIELRPSVDLLDTALDQWLYITIPLAGDATWTRTDVGSPDLAAVAFVEIHADTWDAGFTLWIDGLAFNSPPPATWPMRQRDMMHTGRADYAVPAERMNGAFFGVFLWQTPSPGSPSEGNLSSASMTFYDGAGPDGADIVVGTYHWPKGIQGMDRHTGRRFWADLPAGGETIGTMSPAFSNDGGTIYVINDATESSEFPKGHPLMAFPTISEPADFTHNGDNAEPGHLSMDSPTIGPDGRIFLHGWGDRPYAGTDSGSAITETWAAATGIDGGHCDPSLYLDGEQLQVIAGGRGGQVHAYDGATGAELWSTNVGVMIDATATIDPANGKIYVGCGSDDVYVAGLDKNGNPLWSDPAVLVFDYVEGTNSPQRAQAAGCLSHDGETYYFQTNSEQGDGRLYAISTADGSLKWSYETHSKGGEVVSSSPIVTTNGVIIVGNNDNGTYHAIRDDGSEGTLLDTLDVTSPGNARASATLSSDGRLYLPLRMAWVAGNGDGQTPTYNVGNLFSAIDLTVGAAATLWPPGGQTALAANNAVSLSWHAVPDPSGQFDHYAVYRDTAPFTSVADMTPITTVDEFDVTNYLDSTAENGTHYYYAVTTVAAGGQEITAVPGIGPRTPWDETDLQVVSISRTPRYPRYAAVYTDYDLSEPSGFGPYWFSAATGLGDGQDAGTQRWPGDGDPVIYTTTVRNRGSNPWSGTLACTWRVDGVIVAQPSQTVTLEPGDILTFAYVMNWDGQSHDISFTIDVVDARPANNTLTINTKSVAFLSYIDRSRIEVFREETPGYPLAATDDFTDWLNHHMTRFNQMFADAGCQKRVHFDVLEVLADDSPDPGIDTMPFAIFPFRYHASDDTLRLTAYYRADDDIDYGLLHEMGHQLGLIDIYRLNVPAEANEVSGLGYSGPTCLMNGCSPVISQHSALAMNHWLDTAHGYYGQYMYNIPAQMRLRILGFNGQPLSGATVKVYQYCDRPNQGSVISNQLKTQGTTDMDGLFTLPNVPIDPATIPPAYTGDELHANPFGNLAVVGSNGVLHFRIEYGGGVDYAWLDVTEANVAYFTGHPDTATFDRPCAIGGPTQYLPPNDMTEINATDWTASADGSDPSHTYVQDDTARKIVGAGSVKFVTDGGFDTFVRYPRSFTAIWDLTPADSLNLSFYAENPNFSFQGGSPWIRLTDTENNYFEYQYFVDDSPADILDEAYGTWRTFQIPLDASPTESNGWRRTAHGTPSLAHTQYLEIHADTWGYGFTLWLDGVGFDPPLRSYGDFDGDRDVDLVDFAHFRSCFNGSNRPPVQVRCVDVLSDGDNDADLIDFARFRSCFNGSNRPPKC